MLENHQSELIEHAMAVGALKFGTFTLKSGRYPSRWDLKFHLYPHGQSFFPLQGSPRIFSMQV